MHFYFLYLLLVKLLSRVRLFATPGMQPTRLLRPWNFPGKRTGAGCHFLLQGIIPTQGLNPGLPYCRQMLYHLSHQGSPSSSYVHTKMFFILTLQANYLELSIFKKYLFDSIVSSLGHAGFLVAACKLLVGAHGVQFPDQGSNPGPHIETTES